MAARNLYLHELIDIVGQGQYDYMDHSRKEPTNAMPNIQRHHHLPRAVWRDAGHRCGKDVQHAGALLARQRQADVTRLHTQAHALADLHVGIEHTDLPARKFGVA